MEAKLDSFASLARILAEGDGVEKKDEDLKGGGGDPPPIVGNGQEMVCQLEQCKCRRCNNLIPVGETCFWVPSSEGEGAGFYCSNCYKVSN